LAKILSAHGLSDFEPLGSDCRTLHLELDKPLKDKGYAIGRRLGIEQGKERFDGGDGEIVLLWDTKFDSLPVNDGQAVLWALSGYSKLPDEKQFKHIAENCTLLIDADVLRKSGALVSKQISWERTAIDLMRQLLNNKDVMYLLAARDLVVSFAEDAAVHIFHDGGNGLRAQLVLAHGFEEGRLRREIPGDIDDAFIVMAAALALQLADSKPLRLTPLLASAKNLLEDGYTIELLKESGHKLAPYAEDAQIFNIPIGKAKKVIADEDWCISNSVEDTQIFRIALDLVRNGQEGIASLPKITFGKLTTVDRWEIEAYQNIKNLITKYSASASDGKPLSIAVFGSPGSGKSFGIKQIAENLLGGVIENITFNVSQFTDFDDVGSAFQKVRDITIKGKLPLVFFDEFDSSNGETPLGWVKYFLMPMEDGKFKDASGEHTLGKCILIFAGGTSTSFEEFNKADGKTGSQAEKDAFRERKGPDFVSRLRGMLNVLGPNPKSKEDKNYLLRRALLLRGNLEDKKRGMVDKNGKALISESVLWAMLLVPEYKHGARSMGAIIDMSRVESNKAGKRDVWVPDQLPCKAQLSLHVNAEAFLSLVLKDVVLGQYTEQFAFEIANYYEKKYAGMPYAVPWEELPEEIKENNRVPARNITGYLTILGYSFDMGETSFEEVKELAADEELTLAKQTHIDWMDDKKAKGWTYAPVRDDELKQQPLLVDWQDLPDAEKEKDFDIVRNIITMLNRAGLRVCRIV
jgi:hypothetical protein